MNRMISFFLQTQSLRITRSLFPLYYIPPRYGHSKKWRRPKENVSKKKQGLSIKHLGRSSQTRASFFFRIVLPPQNQEKTRMRRLERIALVRLDGMRLPFFFPKHTKAPGNWCALEKSAHGIKNDTAIGPDRRSPCWTTKRLHLCFFFHFATVRDCRGFQRG